MGALAPLVFAFVLLAAGQADAQGEREQALRVFGEAVEAYEAGGYDRAATLFAAAYELHPEPVLLFNLARSLEKAGDTERAEDAYRRYVALGDELPDQAEASERLEALERERATGEAAPTTEAPLTEWWEQGDEEEPEPESEPVSYAAPVALAVGGALVLVAGAISGVAAKRDHDVAVDPRTSHAQAIELGDRANRRQRWANALLVLGGLGAAAGFGWTIARWRRSTGEDTELTWDGSGLRLITAF